MYIGVDATCWWNRRGFGRFTRGLLKAMLAEPRGNKFCLFVDRAPDSEMDHPDAKIIEVSVTNPVTKSAVAQGHRSLRDLWNMSRAASAEPIDIMFFPAVYSSFPVLRRVPVSMTLHDAIAEHLPQLIFPDRVGRMFWSWKMRSAVWRASRIITVSNAAKEEIVRYVRVPSRRIDVICEGADPRFHPILDPVRRMNARRSAGLPNDARLLLYVGGIAPHKNLNNLVKGFAEVALRPEMKDVHLAIVGDPAGDGFHSSSDQLVRSVNADSRLTGRVHFTGFVSDDDLAALYSDALATVLPALSEGFGLPALESMACGTPVLTSSVGAAPEVMGEAGFMFDPHDPSSIARQIFRAASDAATWNPLRETALARAGSYTWARAAELTLASLRASVGAH